MKPFFIFQLSADKAVKKAQVTKSTEPEMQKQCAELELMRTGCFTPLQGLFCQILAKQNKTGY